MTEFDYYLNTIGEIGYVEKINGTIISVSGLPNAQSDEIVLLETGEIGQVFSLGKDLLEILVFTKSPIKPGTRIARTNKNLEAPINETLLGKIINPLTLLATAIDPTTKDKLLPIHILPKGITERQSITKPLETGVSIVDLAIPLAKGQRELIIGDRKTGKSAFLLQTALNQAQQGSLCIYAAIGKKTLDVKKIENFFIKNKIADKTVLIASTPEDASGIINLTPYLAMTIAEYFRDKGNDVLVVLDDLTTHAKVYREISLLAERFPGRNSYPADTFYMHAKLLERAGNFITQKGTFAITCLPVAETAQGDLSGYIPTNLMSTTDGHLYFDSNLFAQGRRPPINPFLSVTRVGRQTQSMLKHTIGREIISFLNLFEKMQNFIHFGAELNQNIKTTINTGNKLLKLFNQPMSTTIPSNVQVLLFSLIWNDVWDDKVVQDLDKYIELLIKRYKSNKVVQEKIDGLSTKKSLNELLGSLRKEYQQIVDLA
jgi:F-type H+/Na+-transporting ATPase subunit alpha